MYLELLRRWRNPMTSTFRRGGQWESCSVMMRAQRPYIRLSYQRLSLLNPIQNKNSIDCRYYRSSTADFTRLPSHPYDHDVIHHLVPRTLEGVLLGRSPPAIHTYIMPRGNDNFTKVYYKGKFDDFVIFVDDVPAIHKWRKDRSVPLQQILSGWKIFVTHRWVHTHT